MDHLPSVQEIVFSWPWILRTMAFYPFHFFVRRESFQSDWYFRGQLNKTGQSDCRKRTMNFNQSRLNQSRVDRKQQLKPKFLELFTVRIILWSDWPVLSDPGNSRSVKSLFFSLLLWVKLFLRATFLLACISREIGDVNAQATFRPEWEKTEGEGRQCGCLDCFEPLAS